VERWPRKTAKDVEGRAKRYELTEDGISPMGLPGEPNGQYVATGIEHDEWGHPAYTPEFHTAMQQKRWKKLEPLTNGAARHEYYGDAEPEIALIGFGSTYGPVREGVDMARAEGISVGAFYPRVLGPFPVDTVRDFTAKASRVVVPEINFTGQLARLVRAEVGISVDSRAKCDGLPFTAEDIYEMITEAAR
jgi:2-oxoglutarate ferredoxin oxidoreductase subunit alpha